MTAPIHQIHPSSGAKSVTILGSTGTIGKNTIDIIKQHPERFRIYALTAGRNVDALIEQSLDLKPSHAVIQDEHHYGRLKDALDGSDIQVAAGDAAIINVASEEVDIVMSGIVGSAALAPTLAAIKAGSTIALANKECLVCAGSLVMAEVKKYGTTLLPVDSEHNAIFQALGSTPLSDVERFTLTASGGPFRTSSLEQIQTATPKQAVAHPNWSMGAKISVDSATMMNKGLELIEAHYLFDIQPEKLDVLVHPQSIVHSLLQFADGSVVAGMSVPDMRVPIAHSLAWPERVETNTARLDLATLGTLHFEAPDYARFPAPKLALDALALGGNAPLTLNAANEIAVQAFLDQQIGFLDIVNTVQHALEEMPEGEATSLDDVAAIDTTARRAAHDYINTLA